MIKHFADLSLTGHILTDFLLTSATPLTAAGKLRYDATAKKYYGYTTAETALLTKLDESSLNVNSASKLATARELWGNSFDGTADVNGDITLGSGKKIYFGGTTHFIGVDEDGNLYTDSGFYSTSFISARGKDDSGSSGGGTDLEKVWESLTGTVAPYATSVINKAHIPDIEMGKVTGLSASLSAINTNIANIQALIPSEASSGNQLADKAFVNSSISTATAAFAGTVTSEAALKALAGDLNDYAFYSHKDAAGNTVYDRYKYDPDYNSATTGHWKFEYSLNNSSFTAAQWSAINSGITDNLVTKLNGIAAGAQVNVIESVKVNGAALAVSGKAVDITVATGSSNGTLKVNNSDISVKGLAALAYKASLAWSEVTGKPESFTGYGFTAGNGLAASGMTVSAKVDTGGEFLSVSASGLKVSGVSTAISNAVSGAVFISSSSATSGTSLTVTVSGRIRGVSTQYGNAECICEVTYGTYNTTAKTQTATISWGFTATSSAPMTINVFYTK